MEDKLNGRRSEWKTTSRKSYRKQMTSACLASKFCNELSPAQPQLVLNIVNKDNIASKCSDPCNTDDRRGWTVDGTVRHIVWCGVR